MIVKCRNCGEEIRLEDRGHGETWLHSHAGDYGYWCWRTHAEPEFDMDKMAKEATAHERLERLST